MAEGIGCLLRAPTGGIQPPAFRFQDAAPSAGAAGHGSLCNSFGEKCDLVAGGCMDFR